MCFTRRANTFAHSWDWHSHNEETCYVGCMSTFHTYNTRLSSRAASFTCETPYTLCQAGTLHKNCYVQTSDICPSSLAFQLLKNTTLVYKHSIKSPSKSRKFSSNRSKLVIILCSTVDSWLSEPQLFVSGHLDVGSCRHVLVPMREIHCSHWSFATGESNAPLRTTFPNATTHFPSSIGLSSQFTTSNLAERSCERCRTLYYVVAN